MKQADITISLPRNFAAFLVFRCEMEVDYDNEEKIITDTRGGADGICHDADDGGDGVCGR